MRIEPELGGYPKYPWASLGYHSSIPVWSSQGMSDTLIENWIIDSDVRIG
jgi:hypothetical protein